MAGAEASRKEGNRFLAAGDLVRAEECYRRAATQDPRSAAAHIALGFVLLQRRNAAEAKQALERAADLAPGEADAHYLLGTIARSQYALDEAAMRFRQATEARADFAEAHLELGIALRGQRRHDEALRCLERALALQPGDPSTRLNKALVHLFRGEFAEGLELFESRLDGAHSSAVTQWLELLGRRSAISRWRGEPLRGRRLVLWVEEGAGDCIMVMRYLPLLAARGAGAITVLSDPSLARVLATFPVVGRVATRIDEVPLDALDFHSPMMSLPYAFGTRADTIPATVPYVSVPAALRQHWSRRLAPLKRPKVGLVWAGSRSFASDALRSLEPGRLRPLVAAARGSFVNLQKGAGAPELAALGGTVFDPMPDCVDYLDTAAVVSDLDLVISVDTSVAHLAGALGKPVWLLNRFESEWRWRLGREDSAWYPTMRIFTQPAFGDWDGVIARVASELSSAA